LSEHLLNLDELELLAADPNVFLVHKIAHEYQRAAVERILRFGPDPAAAAQRLMLAPPIQGLGRRKHLRITLGRFRTDLAGMVQGP
ncbi:MAG TPA: hypothetical protein VFC99_01385, partial [Acidimicrobiia bacterium]|nr:hypothetical protein [Acidimicrobiia bacterium]